MTAAFILAQYWSTSGADDLGRLFTTLEERSLLEKLRNPPPAGNSQAPPAVDPAMREREPENRDIAVKGFVYRKNGRSTVWINSAHMRATDASDAVDVLIDNPDGALAIEALREKISHPHMTE